MSMTSPVGSYPQPFFGFTPSPHPHMMQTPQPTTPVPSYTTPVWATTLIEEVKALTAFLEKWRKR